MEWLPPEFKRFQPVVKIEMSLSSQDISIEIEKGISLSQLLTLISQAVTQAFPKAEWIKGEISECHAKAGRFFI